MGKLLVVAGLVIAAVGALVIAGVPIGRFPGDLIYRRGNATFYFPLATSVILSIVLTVLMAIFRR